MKGYENMANLVSGRIYTAPKKYTNVPTSILLDKSISLGAKGLYVLIIHYADISNYDKNFVFNKTLLENMCIEGTKKFNGSWKELKEKGYIIQHKKRNENNSYYYEYEVLDEPNPEIYKKEQAERKEKQKKKAMQEFNLTEQTENKQHGEYTDMPPQMFQQGQASSSNQKSVNLDITFDE